MIDVFVGKPRNGKSLRAMSRMLKTLIETNRQIITNMVLDLDAIQDYVDKRDLQINVRRRFTFFSSLEEMKHFWLVRAYHIIPKPADYDDPKGKTYVAYDTIIDNPDYWEKTPPGETPRLKGTMYVIDEVNSIYPARGWQGTPRHLDYYTAQHGKLNDEIIFICQNTKLVDPNLYRIAETFQYCRNHRLRKIGYFKGANKFTAHIYDGPANDNKQQTLTVDTYSLDLEVARCYDTSAGVGFKGGGAADGAARAKGIPLTLIWVLIGVVLVFVYWFFNYWMPQKAHLLLNNTVKNGTLSVEKSLGSSPGQRPTPPAAPVRQTDDIQKPQDAKQTSQELTVSGWVLSESGAIVQLSDGSRRFVDRATWQRDGVGRIRANYVEVDGVPRPIRFAPVEQKSPAFTSPRPSEPAKTIVVNPLPFPRADDSQPLLRPLAPASLQYR